MEKYTIILISVLFLVVGCGESGQPKNITIIIDEKYRGWVVLRIDDNLQIGESLGVDVSSDGYAVIPGNLFTEKYVSKYFFKLKDGILVRSDAVGNNIIHGESFYSIDSDVRRNGASINFHIFFVGSELEYENAPSKSDWLDKMNLK
jgi:hypothetical protein